MKKSKVKAGFTLIEIITSMTITMILLVGVFNAYMMLIKNTREGEVKQKATLIGKDFIEKIKASSDEIISEDGKIYLADNIPIDKYSKQGIVKIKRDGSITTGQDYEYEAVISLSKKLANSNDGANGFSYEEAEDNSFVVGDNTIYLSNECPLKEKGDFDITSNLKINIDKYGDGTIGFDGKETKDTNSMNIVLDMKYCTSKVEIDIINNSDNTLNLCVLNSGYMSDGKRNVYINNEKGSVNEYYRTDLQDKGETLYNINIDINEKGDKKKKIFKSTFVKKIKIY